MLPRPCTNFFWFRFRSAHCGRLNLIALIPTFLVFGFPISANTVRVDSSQNSSIQESTDISVGQTLRRELKGGETHSFQLQIKSGQFLYAVVNQIGIDVVVKLLGPSRQTISQVDSPNGNNGPEPLISRLEEAGEYSIQVTAPNKNAVPGRYEITVLALRVATSTDNELLAADRTFWEADKLRLERTATSSKAAIDRYQQALPFFERSGDQYRQALTLTLIASIYAASGEFSRALNYDEQALPVYRAIKHGPGESGTLTSIGGIYDVQGDLSKARDYYQQALVLVERGVEPITEGAILSNIGKTYNDLGNFQNALEYYRRALEVFRNVGEKRREAITLNNIGLVYFRLGDNEKSLDIYGQALSLRRSIGDKAGEASTLTSIGQVYASSGNAQKAIEFYKQALPLRKTAGDRLGEATTLEYFGVAYSALGERDKALNYHQQALVLRRAVSDLRGEAHTLSNLGYVYFSSGDLKSAADYYNQSLALFKRIGDRQNEANVLFGLARVERDKGNLADAQQHIMAALSLFESGRTTAGAEQLRASYFASKQSAYQFYISLLMGMHQPDLALQTSERARARSLLDMLAETQADIRQGVDPALLERERLVRQQLSAKAQRSIELTGQKGKDDQLAQMNKDLNALEEENLSIQAQLRKASPAYAALTQPQPLSAKEIQQQLDPDSVLLEYSLGQERSYLWVVSADAIKTYELPKQVDIEKVARQVYESLTARSVVKGLETPEQRQERIAQADKQFQESAGQLSQMVLEPAASEFGTKRLIVVPDGVLQYVPFAALTVGSAYHPIIQDHEIVSLPSASALAVQRRNLASRKPAAKTLAVIADPVFSLNDSRLKTARSVPVRQALPANETRIIEHLSDNTTGQLSIRRLPFTRQEADQILAVAPSASNLKLLDFRANRSLVTSGELSKYRYIHFATHGYLDSSRADLSAIVLSLVDEKGNPEDGFLRTLDLYNLNLPAELVVLSACETGLGKDVKGEGLVGLTRGFMYAGARRVIVSLWNVNDKATALLMERVYAGMLKTHKTPAAALRAAQIEMFKQKQWQSPYYWAGFVLQGEWK
jgi:CHAT domain-containing protein/tetratricopeptide (TPR) repeat protein